MTATTMNPKESNPIFDDVKAIIADALNSSDAGRIAITCLAEGMVLQKELMASAN